MLGSTPDLQRISYLTAYLLKKTMDIRASGVLVLDRQAGCYFVRAAEGEALLLKGVSISQNNPLFLALSEQRKELLFSRISDERVKSQMQKLKGELFIPIISQLKYFNEETLLGIVYLGAMNSGAAFTGKDIRFFLSMIKQAGTNLDSAFMHEEMRKKKSG